MFKKIALTTICLLAFTCAHAGPTPLINASDLSNVTLHWGGGGGSPKTIFFNSSSIDYDQLHLNILQEGDYVFKLSRPAVANNNATIVLTIGANTYNSAGSGTYWLFSSVHLTVDDYLLSLKIYPTANSAGNPTFGYTASNLVIVPDSPAAQVPEPAALSLLGAGLLGLGTLRRRRKK